MRFVDTNVLLYAVSSRPEEAERAQCAAALLNAPDLALSVHVLQEFYVQATRPSRPSPMAHETAVAFVRSLERFPVAEINLPLVRAALTARARWQISYWDAAIVEAARALGCEVLYSEDLQHGQDYDGVKVTNPFV